MNRDSGFGKAPAGTPGLQCMHDCRHGLGVRIYDSRKLEGASGPFVRAARMPEPETDGSANDVPESVARTNAAETFGCVVGEVNLDWEAD